MNTENNRRNVKNRCSIYQIGLAAAFIFCMAFLFPDFVFAEETEEKRIQDYVYQYNEEFKGIEILSYEGIGQIAEAPETILVIKEKAFYFCEKLEKINLPANLMILGEMALGYCEMLEKITLPSSLKEISTSLFIGCESLKKIRIPKDIVKIQETAFVFSGIKKVVFENGSKLDSIGDSAFESCHNLSEIKILDSVKEIES